MRVTGDHVRFWWAKKAGTPNWASGLKQVPRPSIDWLINSQEPWHAHSSEPDNTMAVLRIMLKRTTLRDALLQLSRSTNAERHLVVGRWLKTLERKREERLTDYTAYVLMHGSVEWQHRLDRDDPMDCDHYAEMYAGEMDMSVELPGTNTGADFDVRITDDLNGVRNWDSKSYFFKESEA